MLFLPELWTESSGWGPEQKNTLSQNLLKSSLNLAQIDSFGQIVWGAPLDLKEWELDLNVHISLQLGRVLHKSSGASCWEFPKPKTWELYTKRTISPELNI